MSQSVVIIAPGNAKIVTFLEAVRTSSMGEPLLVDTESEWVQFGTGASYLVLSRMSSEVGAFCDYGEWDTVADELKSKLDTMSYWSVRYNSISLARSLLLSLLEGLRCPEAWWVDNDYGVVLHGPDFLKLLRGDERWDWRTQNLAT